MSLPQKRQIFANQSASQALPLQTQAGALKEIV